MKKSCVLWWGAVGKFLSVLVLLAGAKSLPAYSPPPDWDPMLMLNVTLNASNQLGVQTTANVIRLAVAPGGYNSTNKTYDLSYVTFDPTQPYAVLNRAAYSRVLGWYDEGTTGANGDDFYATYAAQLKGTNYVWIEKTGGSTELNTYFVNEDVTGDPGSPYTPIFGTDGSSTKWRWDGFMDHNAYAVELSNLRAPYQLFTATYHLFIGDAAGNPTPGYGDTTTTWRWQGPAVPVIPAPAIAVTNSQVLVSWPSTVSNLVLMATDALPSDNWRTVTNAAFSLNGQTAVLLDLPASQQFFRLKLSP